MESSKHTSRRQRSAKSRPGNKVELQFVNVAPNGQDQKAKQRALIRANAAHFHWRHNRPPVVQTKVKKSKCEGVDKHDEINRPTPLLSKSSQLGFDIVDPFSSYESDLPTDFVSRCITFNARFILPALFPDAIDNVNNPRASMLQQSFTNPCILHMFIIGALVNSQGSLGIVPGSRIAMEIFRSHTEIIRRLSIVLRDPAKACEDSNIFAIVALAKNGRFRKLELPLKMPKQGPLRNLQYMNSFGLTDSDPIHANGLLKVIELKGGLEKIEMPGLAAIISFGGLRIATRELSVPYYPVVTLSCPSKLFKFQHQGVGFGADQDLSLVLSMLNSYNIMIDDHCEGRKVVSASVLIDHRNTTQHALLSLPPKKGNSECYRLAALIFSLLVTFPLPYIAAPFQRLVTQLKLAISQWDADDQMLIWVLAMGGIGATGLEEREWFVNEFRLAVARLGLRNWDEAKEMINKGIWYDATNDRDGYDLWLESQYG